MDPNLGDVKRAYEIGKVGQRYYLWVMCPMCSEERWAIKKTGYDKGSSRLCRQCVIAKAKRSFKIGNS